MKFLIRKMDRAQAWKRNWTVLEPYMAHIAVQYPHVFDYVARVVAWGLRDRLKIDRPLWREVIGNIAYKSAGHGRDSELLWALWLYAELEYKVPRQIMERAVANSGALSLAYSVHPHKHGIVTNPNWLNMLARRIEGPDQYSSADWPITLELFATGQEAPLLAARPLDGSLMQKPFQDRTSIVKWRAYPQVFYDEIEDFEDDGDIDLEDLDPDFAIEDFTSSYDDDDDDDEDDGWMPPADPLDDIDQPF